MMSFASPAFKVTGEGFVNHMNKREPSVQGFGMAGSTTQAKPVVSGFANYSGDPAGAKGHYAPMGQFDGVKLSTGNAVSDWRYTKPNEPLLGVFPKFEPGNDNLFMFKDNQCKPECCGSSFSCNGGCVCTTPEQRTYINERGGNRTGPDAGV